ncbi:MAG: polysaccharide deacetylase family protein [Bacillota bacterium]|nr:polysaccharide deacetylase family protein [Bacillota bacterium]
MQGFYLIIASLLMMLMIVSCQSQSALQEEDNKKPLPQDSLQAEKDRDTLEENNEEVEQVEAAGEIPPELQEPQPNELGEYMILMYHEIGHPESEWRRTPENFRRDLQILYEQGYRAVSLNDMVRGTISIPAGTSPVVFAFDDANKGNFNYLEINGGLEIDPDCAVAIMESFHEENPDFGLAATFFIYYPNPFRQSGYIQKKLDYLVEKGFEIGNHTYGHGNLGKLTPAEIQRELAEHIRATQEYLPGYEVKSLALPYGAYPKDPELAVQGSHGGTSYSHESVLLVGFNPSPSPFQNRFDPYRLPRIRASEMNTAGVGLYDWLEYFIQNPHKRYISDGNDFYITAPKSLEGTLDESSLGDKKARFYED